MESEAKHHVRLQLLVVRFQRGDSSAFKEIIEGWERPLFYYVRRFVDREEDAWDVLQEVWMKVLNGLRKLRDSRAASAWLYKCARNAAVGHLRKTRRHETLYDNESVAEQAERPIELSVGPDDAVDLHRAVQSLPLPQRDAVVLHFLEGFSLEEISGITETPVGTVKSRLHYAKVALKEYLTQEAKKQETKKGERHA